MSEKTNHALAKLAGYKIHAEDIHNDVWVYPKREGVQFSFRYLPAVDLRLLMECARGISTLRHITYDYGVLKGIKCVTCTLSIRIEGGSQAFINIRESEEEALYVSLQDYLHTLPEEPDE